MPTIITRGAGSAQGLGYASSSAPVNYIEDVFSTYLYTGTGASLPIVNGIDLAGEGGLVWTKARNSTAFHKWYDSARGIEFAIESNTTDANQSELTGITSFNSNGYTYGTDGNTNSSGTTYASWTFRKQPKFFDVVTYTGNGVAGRTVAHNLGSAPGCMFVKRTDAAGSWHVFHTSLGGTKTLFLNATNAASTNIRYWNDTAPTSTVFTLGFDTDVNASGGTYVAYLFAHNAGGFGLTGTDNVISCGSFTTDGSGKASVNLGYEPQWLMLKNSTSADNWYVLDNMRGFSMSQGISLNPNLTAAESDYFGGNTLTPNATGFSINNNIGAGATWIYVSIRRGPMKVPTSGTSVYSPSFFQGSSPRYVGGFPVDLGIYRSSLSLTQNNWFATRLLGATRLNATSTAAEGVEGDVKFDYMNGFYNGIGGASSDQISWLFRRAPGFFDEVCYTGTGGANLQTHNLGVTPELLIIRSRSQSGTYGGYWLVLSASGSNYRSLFLNTTDSNQGNFAISSISTSTTVNIGYIGSNILTASNTSAATFVAYLFATCPGVSKVGSYTGTGTTQVINCGFTAGSRFVMIKRTDAAGDWYVWDSARGIVAGNDPHISLNTTAAEVTTDDSVDTDSTGFVVNQVAATNINVASASYIFLAVS